MQQTQPLVSAAEARRADDRAPQPPEEALEAEDDHLRRPPSLATRLRLRLASSRPSVACASAALASTALAALMLLASRREPLAPRPIPLVRLSNGVELPLLLLGTGATTWMNSSAAAAQVHAALLAGFPGVDTANHYRNQRGVARGIAAARAAGWSGRLWLQTKVEGCGASVDPRSRILSSNCFNGTYEAVLRNLEELGVERVDLTLLHSPPCVAGAAWVQPAPGWPGGCGGNPAADLIYPHRCDCAATEPCAMMREQWRALEAAYAAGLTRAIGVSNYCAACLACLAAGGGMAPHVNQFRLHAGMPGDDPAGLVGATQRYGAVVQAYQPLAHGEGSLLRDATLQQIGRAYGKSAAQVALRWVLQLGKPLVTSSESVRHMKSDLDVVDWELTEEHMKTLTALDTHPDDPTPMCVL
ncbi:hypothetical protein AB1Y20_019619 [Prymnesium parvum]|uniref:NADP-dependent oxidoreductase domain-containing protein n=1 Tax=Prymnesium parvum TaxID=97485 RepID=A0AB34JRM6_PRYPA